MKRKLESGLSNRTIPIINLIILFLLIFIIAFFSSASNQLDVRDGHVYSSELVGESGTLKWGGSMGTINSNPVSISREPFFARYINDANVFFNSIPGGNLDQSKYNLIIMSVNTSFNVSLLRNTTISDLSQGVLFPDSMYGGHDSPDNTFDCVNRIQFQLNGVNFSACHATIPQGVEMGLLKYNYNGDYVPVYVVDTSSFTCYNNTNCNFEFLLPINNSNPYYYYYISKFPEYSIRVWIDYVETTTFDQTALPYYVVVQVLNYYTGAPIPNIDVAIMEDQGNNIFVPLRLDGIVSRAMSITQTNSSGKALFIIAPTEYPVITNYSINASVIIDDEIVKTKGLSVSNALSISLTKKSLSPSTLLDNAKVAVNAMNQIANSLYVWANSVSGSDSPDPEANLIDVTVYTNGSYSPQTISVQTGAPNVITVTLKTPSETVVDGYVKAREESGYLIMNPVYNSTDTGYKEHYHRLFWVPTQQSFVITPTSYGTIDSDVKLDIYDSSKNYITTINLSINPNLEPRSGSYYDNDDLKVIVNAMAAVLNSLYYALN